MKRAMGAYTQQLKQVIELLRKQQCPFIVALNKMDVLYQWVSEPDACGRQALVASCSRELELKCPTN
eukprot:1739308-Amphidinium_carterae.2